MVKTGLIPIIRLVFIDESAGAIRSSGRATGHSESTRDSGTQGSASVPTSASRMRWRARVAKGKFCVCRRPKQTSTQPKRNCARKTLVLYRKRASTNEVYLNTVVRRAFDKAV